LESSGLSTASFTFLVSPEFSAKDKVAIHIQADGRNISNANFPNLRTLGEQVPTPVPFRVTQAVPSQIGNRCAIRSKMCKLGFFTSTHLKMQDSNMLFITAVYVVDLRSSLHYGQPTVPS
jgi:hypothetical protein